MIYDEVADMVASIIDCDHFDRSDYEPIFMSRTQFFVRGLEAYERRGRALDDRLRAHFADRPDCRPAKGALSGGLTGRPMTLASVCRLKRALDELDADTSLSSEPLRQALTIGRPPALFSIGARSIVASIYYIRPQFLRSARESMGYKRLQAARLVYGSLFSRPRHEHLFTYLEEGFTKNRDNGTKAEYKITRFLAERIFETMKIGFGKTAVTNKIADQADDVEWLTVFSSQSNMGPKGGDNTEALPITSGNLLSPMTLEEADVSAAI